MNLRRGPSRTSESIRLLDIYAFALVEGAETDSTGEAWYRINQSGTDGYVMQKYFTVLSMDELSVFLTSDEYRNASDNTFQYSDASARNIQALEDYNRGVWQNPAVSVSYAPFAVNTATPSATRTPAASPTATSVPLSTYGSGGVVGTPSTTYGPTDAPAAPEKKDSGPSALGIVLAGASAALLGGGVYIYHIHRKNERRRRAVREQQARQAARAAAYPRTSRAGGYTQRRDTSPSDRTQRVDSAPFMPPSGKPAGGLTPVGKNGADDDGRTGVFSTKDLRPEENQGTGEWGEKTGQYDPWKKQPENKPDVRFPLDGPNDAVPGQRTRVVPTPPKDSGGGSRQARSLDNEKTGEETPRPRHRRSDRYRTQEESPAENGSPEENGSGRYGGTDENS